MNPNSEMKRERARPGRSFPRPLGKLGRMQMFQAFRFAGHTNGRLRRRSQQRPGRACSPASEFRTNSIIFLGLLVALTFLPAGGVFAQIVSTNVPGATEVLPASSPYGEATIIRDIPYVAHPAARQNFDLILPAQRGSEPFPLIVWVHGGAWMLGIKEWDNVKYLVRHGYAIANIDYRFSTEVPFPAQIQDCNTALNFILAHATNYGINPKKFIIGGGSAGGQLALLLGLARDERDFGADPSIKPLAILDFFGPVDFNRTKADLEAIHSEKGLQDFNDAVGRLLGVPVDQPSETARLASPITYVSAGSPPVLMLHGSRDESVPVAQSRRLHEALDGLGVKNQLMLVDAGHDGPLFSTPEIESKVVSFVNEIFAVTPVQDNGVLINDLARIQGTWTMVSGERDGQAFPSEYLNNSERVVKGDETIVTVRGQLFMKAKFSLDPSKNPKTIDYAINDGPYAGQKMFGIYELDGGKLTFCLATPGKERPAGFATKPDDGQTMTVWKLEKK